MFVSNAGNLRTFCYLQGLVLCECVWENIQCTYTSQLIVRVTQVDYINKNYSHANILQDVLKTLV